MKTDDPLVKLKYIAYCRVFSPPDIPLGVSDFTDMARAALCYHTKTLWNDPIWNLYNDESIIVEYFALLFFKDDEFKSIYEAQVGITPASKENIYDWLEAQVDKNKKERTEKEELAKEDLSLNLKELGG